MTFKNILEKMKFKDILQATIILIITAVLVIGATWISNTTKNTEQPKVIEVPFSAVDCPKDSGSYQKVKASKNIILLSDKQSYGISGEGFVKLYDISIKRTGLNSEIACGYLFYRLSSGGKPISQNYENFFMIPRESLQFGGHILTTNNTISNSEINGKTEILLPLNDISYDGIERKNIKQANWVALLNVSDLVNFTIALNTLNQLGHIDSVEIAYKCWNPITGQETKDCNLEVVK